MIDNNDVDEARAITDQYLKDRQMTVTPIEIKELMAALLLGIKTIYSADWGTSLSFLDQFCRSYVANIKENNSSSVTAPEKEILN